jgi:VWFA-related protein
MTKHGFIHRFKVFRFFGAAGLTILLLSGCLVVCITLASPQSVNIEPRIRSVTHANGGGDNTPNIRVDSNLVLIPVTVVDRHDQMIAGLEKERFKLYEDKVEQVITHFALDDAPVSVGLVFDASGSMDRKMRKSREAVGQFLKTANTEDEFFLVQFNDNVELLCGLTQQSEEIQNRLMWIRPKGRTALLDAIYFSIQQMKKAHNTRKAIIIISDGGDNYSRYSIGEIKNAVRETDVQIYAIGIFDPPDTRARTFEELSGPTLLGAVAEQSGGRLFEIDDVNELPDVALKIGQAIRNQYILGYMPANLRRDGKYRTVKVTLTLPKGFPKARASWRRGYYAPLD